MGGLAYLDNLCNRVRRVPVLVELLPLGVPAAAGRCHVMQAGGCCGTLYT